VSSLRVRAGFTIIREREEKQNDSKTTGTDGLTPVSSVSGYSVCPGRARLLLFVSLKTEVLLAGTANKETCSKWSQFGHRLLSSDKQRALDLAGPVLICFANPLYFGLRISPACRPSRIR
jgi:hypothetical protein